MSLNINHNFDEILSEVSKEEPCRHCGCSKWCYRLENGLEVCKRDQVSEGWYKTRASDANGSPYLASKESKEEFLKELKSSNFQPKTRKDRSIYDYTDTSGNPTVRVVVSRKEGEKKRVYRSYWIGGNWVYGKSVKKESSQPLVEATTWYRFSEILKAIENEVPIYIVEGEGVADSLWDIGIAATTMLGGSVAIKKALAQANALEGASLILAPDWDEPGIKFMKKLSEAFPEAHWWFPPNTNWESLPTNEGCDAKDWIKSGGSKESIQSNMLTRNEVVSRLNHIYKTDKPLPIVLGEKSTQADVADFIALDKHDSLAWNSDHQRWYEYNKDKGIWEEKNAERTGLLCSRTASRAGMNVSGSTSTGIQRLLKERLAQWDWEPNRDLICLEDCVVNIHTLESYPHSPQYKFLSQLPYRWADRHKGCEKIKDFLLEANSGFRDRVQLLRAAMNISVTERGDFYQRFLELVGTGGSGKGTVLNLVSQLCGKENTKITNLPALENNRFETSDIFGKKLVLITDSEKYHGDVAVLKALSGGDLIRNERKCIQQLKPFLFRGLVWIAGNIALATNEHTSGFKRRRISLPFDVSKKPEDRRNLKEEFEPFLAGLLYWVLSMPKEEVDNYMLRTPQSVPSLKSSEAEILVETNPLAGWAQQSLIHSPSLKTYVGNLKKEPAFYLYPSYMSWCEAAGHKAVSLSKFSRLLVDLLKVQLGFAEASKHKDRNGAYLTGFSLRRIGDFDSPLLFGEQCDDLVTTSVTTQTYTGDDFDDCDNYSTSSPNRKNPEDSNPAQYKKIYPEPVTVVTPTSNPYTEGSTQISTPSQSHHQPITSKEKFPVQVKIGDFIRPLSLLSSDSRIYLVEYVNYYRGTVKVAGVNQEWLIHAVEVVNRHEIQGQNIFLQE